MIIKKREKKKPKENKQAKREVGGESTQVSLYWLILWINYKNWKVTTKTAMKLIPFSCMLRTFPNDEDIVSPALLLCSCGRGISLLVQLIQIRSLIHYEQIVWENSGIKWIKVPSISLTVTKYLTFNFLGTFCERLKLIADNF